MVGLGWFGKHVAAAAAREREAAGKADALVAAVVVVVVVVTRQRTQDGVREGGLRGWEVGAGSV